jgi:hypothetical protein
LASWVKLLKPKDITPSIFAISTRKNFTINKGLTGGFQVSKINSSMGLTTTHIIQFVELWSKVCEVHLVKDVPDNITSKFTTSREYTPASSYKAQFEGMTRSYMPEAVWKNWAPLNANISRG